MRHGYLEDPYVDILAGAESHKRGLSTAKQVARKPPLIHRGTAVRTKAIDHLVLQFLSTDKFSDSKRQIVNLGAGSDTRYFNFKHRGLTANLAKWVEIDFDQVVLKKAKILHQNNGGLFSELLGQDVALIGGGTRFEAGDYVLFGADLRKFEMTVIPALLDGTSSGLKNGPILDKRLPTLFILECVLPYLPTANGNAILSWASSTFENAAVIIYEMMVGEPATTKSFSNPTTSRNGGDAFGRMMAANLAARQIPLPSMFSYPTIQTHVERLRSLGWAHAEAHDIDDIHDNSLHSTELSKMNKLEQLDEVEEWKLLGKHYVVAFACKGASDWHWSLKNIGG